MKRFLPLVVLLITIGMLFPLQAFAQAESSDSILHEAQQQLQPASIQKTQQEQTNSFVNLLCVIPGVNQLLGTVCWDAVSYHNIVAPDSEAINPSTNSAAEQIQEIEEIQAELSYLTEQIEAGEVAGTASGEVLQSSQNIFQQVAERITRIFSDEKPIVGHIKPARGTQPEGSDTVVRASMSLLPARVAQTIQLRSFTPTPDPDNPNVTPVITPGSSGPVSGPHFGTSCDLGSGPCSVENLRNYFSTEQAARQASVICQKESGSNPNALNDGCLSGNYVDYSVGLFQVNLLAHCPGAFSFSWDPISCQVLDMDKVRECEARLRDPANNIREAVRISGDGASWKAWSAAAPQHCNITPETVITFESELTPPVSQPDAPSHPGQYVAVFQNEPAYASIPHPGSSCTYINNSCGPFTVVNILNNSGYSVTPQEIMAQHFRNIGCNYTTITQAKNALSSYGFTFETVFGGYDAAPSEVAGQIKRFTDAGHFVWANTKHWESGRGKWVLHILMVTHVTDDGRIFVIDPYYGYDHYSNPPGPRAIPMDQSASGQTIQYLNAFAVKKP